MTMLLVELLYPMVELNQRLQERDLQEPRGKTTLLNRSCTSWWQFNL